MAANSDFSIPPNMTPEDIEAAWILLSMRAGTNLVSEPSTSVDNDSSASAHNSVEENTKATTPLSDRVPTSSQVTASTHGTTQSEDITSSQGTASTQGTTPSEDITSSQALRRSSRMSSLAAPVVYNSKWHPMDEAMKPKRAAKVRDSMGKR